MSPQETQHQLALTLVPGIGNVLAKTLISHCGSAIAVAQASPGKLAQIPGVGPKAAEALAKLPQYLPKAEEELANITRENLQLLPYSSPQYPMRLKHINDSPALLYTKGAPPFENPRSLAIVGTRKATQYGLQVLERLFEALAPYRPLIISGLAYGIDIQAHKLALKHGLPTIGVMASGFRHLYPAAHASTAQHMLEQGGWVSEHALGTKPQPAFFPARNRIIAGLADATIVVEAAEKGGALITADVAFDYNREVFAVPGPLGAKYSEGCNRLIQQQKAHLLTSADYLAQALNWDQPYQEAPTPLPLHEMPAPQQAILGSLAGATQPLHLQQIALQTALPLNGLASQLLQLECDGYIKALPGHKYRLSR